MGLRITVQGIRLDIAPILKQSVEDVHRLVNAAGDEMTEQRDISVRDVVVTDAAVTAIADVVLAEQVLLVEIPLGAIGGGPPTCTPVSRQFVLLVRVDDLDDSAI